MPNDRKRSVLTLDIETNVAGMFPWEQSESRLNRPGIKSVEVSQITIDAMKKAMMEAPIKNSKPLIHISESQFNLVDISEWPANTLVMMGGESKTVAEIRKERLKFFNEVGS